jgi:hypothetical protein
MSSYFCRKVYTPITYLHLPTDRATRNSPEPYDWCGPRILTSFKSGVPGRSPGRSSWDPPSGRHRTGTGPAPGHENVDFTYVFKAKRRLGHFCQQPALPDFGTTCELFKTLLEPYSVQLLKKNKMPKRMCKCL